MEQDSQLLEQLQFEAALRALIAITRRHWLEPLDQRLPPAQLTEESSRRECRPVRALSMR